MTSTHSIYNKYLTFIGNNCLSNKYTKIYISLCVRARKRIDTSKTYHNQKCQAKKLFAHIEAHHIWPRCICNNQDEQEDLDNFAMLTIREHFIAHRLLAKMFESIIIKGKMTNAITMFSRNKEGRRLTSRQYEICRKLSKNLINVRNIYTSETIRVDKNNIPEGYIERHIGTKHSESTKAKMSKASKGVKKTEEHKRKISVARKGMLLGSQSEEHKHKISVALKGIVRSKETNQRRRDERVKDILQKMKMGHWEEFSELIRSIPQHFPAYLVAAKFNIPFDSDFVKVLVVNKENIHLYPMYEDWISLISS